jgi:aminopeptidase N
VTDTLRLKAGDGLRVSSADVDGHPVDARRADGELLLPLPPGPTDRPGIVVTLEYEASARGGLRISEEAAFTYFHTDSWLPVHGDLDDRATLDLLVETPLRWRVVAPGGRLKPPEPYFDSTMRWVLVEPAPPYLFGFAAAPLRETRLDDFRNPTLLVLVHHDVPEAEVRRAFRDTRRMVAFLEEKAGIPLHPSVYRQVLLPDARRRR